MDLNKDIKDIHLNVNSSTFNILYRKYREFILHLFIIFASLILFLIVILPQIRSVLDQRELQRIEQIKLDKLRNNYNLLSSMDKATLDNNLSSLSKALPSNKDFAGIISSISDNSLRAGVSVGDFSFVVGDISGNTGGVTSFPSLQIILSVSGDPASTLNFVNLLYESVPLAEITTLSGSTNASSITVQFYYKSFPQEAVSDETQITPLSTKDQALIDKVTSWAQSSSGLLVPIGSPEVESSPSSSGSAASPF